MHDPAYKLLFSRPRMVRDLLDGFAARGWSGALDFDTLAPLPASFVSEDLRQRHGDLVWRIRFRDDRWLYLVLLLEFQATVDRAMALRMLTYTALLYQRLAADDVLRDHGVLPPVLPVVLYNGRRPWTASIEMTDLVAVGSELLAPYQPSQRYYLLDGARMADADLPADNLVSALIALEKTRDAARLREALQALSDLLRAQGDEHLTQAFVTWLHEGLRVAGPLPAGEGDPLTALQETQTMLKENVREWTQEWLEQGIEQGRAQGIEQGRAQGIEQGRAQGVEQAAPRASSRAATKNGRCSAVWRRGSSMPSLPRDWPPPSPALPTPIASRGSATGSSSAPRRRSCSPASAATTDRAVEAPAARTGRRRGIGAERDDAARHLEEIGNRRRLPNLAGVPAHRARTRRRRRIAPCTGIRYTRS